MREALVFLDVIVLVQTEHDQIRCIAASSSKLAGRHWRTAPPAIAVAQPSGGTGTADALHEWSLPLREIPPARPTLCLPFEMRGRRGLLILSRAVGAAAFDAEQASIGGRLACLAAVALALCERSQLEAQGRALRALAGEWRQSEQNAQRNSELLLEIIDLLPLGLTLRNGQGDPILLNRAAATNLDVRAEGASASAPADPPCGPPSAEESLATDALPVGGTVSEERLGPAGERTVLTSHKPVRIFDQTLLLSTSLDITERKQIERELARRAYFDELTGLPNRVLIQRAGRATCSSAGAKTAASRSPSSTSTISSTSTTTTAMRSATRCWSRSRQRIAGACATSDMLARISGDEFVLLIDPVESDEQLTAMVDQLLRRT